MRSSSRVLMEESPPNAVRRAANAAALPSDKMDRDVVTDMAVLRSDESEIVVEG